MAARDIRAQLLARLEHSGPAPDPVAAALGRLPAGIARGLAGMPIIPAAVLVPLLDTADGVVILLTRRHPDLRDHPGQISFPGGRLEPGDRDPAAAALREAAEEIGLDPGQVTVAGFLPAQFVITGFAVTPVVGFVTDGFQPVPAPAEVAEVIAAPLAGLLQPGGLVAETRYWQGTPIESWAWEYAGHRIWGATAQMLKSLRDVLHETR